ncbi:response regulator [Azospirillum sp.]|uniref:response regulator n=1 Tax=Azospirillum sp. TaxID=34012 RepID=UPI002D6E119C|nr:response regulator [Azospirillum sp.]HYF88071.1 response regulator [Azospirillum sp.]
MAGGVHILVAEDEDLVAMALAEVLKAEGFRVTMTYNGQEVIDADAFGPADLLVTDMRIPVLGRKVLIETLRERRPSLPIIVMTGYSEHLPDDDPGRLVVLRKPFSMSTLVRHAEAFLRYPPPVCRARGALERIGGCL